MAVDFPSEIKALRATVETIQQVTDLDRLRAEIAELEQRSSAPDLWDDPDAAQKVTSRLSHKQAELERITSVISRLDDLEIMVELGESEDDAETMADAERELAALDQDRRRARGPDAAHRRVRRPRGRRHHPLRRRRRRRRRLRRDADADVPALGRAARLPDRGRRHLVRRGGRPEVGHLRGEGAVRVRHAVGRVGHPPAGPDLARSTTRAAGRPASPASRCCRVVEQTDHIDIPENELQIDVFRSSGPGGQSVNTTDSAVRITHIPTGIVVSMQNEKSQIQNKAAALQVLQARLLLLRQEQEAAEQEGDGRRRQGQLGRPDALLRPAPVPDGQGPAHRATRSATRRRSSTATSTASSRPASAGGAARSGPASSRAAVPATARTAGNAEARELQVPPGIPTYTRREGLGSDAA